MPARFRLYPDLKFVHTEAYGILRGDDMLAHARALAARPRFAPAYAQLVDFRPVTSMDVTASQIRALVDINPFDRTARRVALVGAQHIYGLLRMYQLLADIEGQYSLVTQSDAEAWAFLEVPPEVVSCPAADTWDSAADGRVA